MENARPHLPVHEWLSIVSLSALLLTLTLFALRGPSSHLVGKPHHLIDPEVDIYIEGAVKKPGAYRVPRQSHVREALDQAGVLPNANLKRLKLDRKVRNGEIINVRQYKRRPKKS
jgi:hypothetical protein